MKKFNKRGLSLLEVLITATILGILGSLAAPQIYNALSKTGASKVTEVQAQVVGAKQRAVLDAGGGVAWDSANATETARFTSIAPYLSVAGVVPTASTDLLGGLGTAATLTINDSTTAPAVAGEAY
jgi:prepilin-type N-terminal cleavage/methylation domain-containing protein